MRPVKNDPSYTPMHDSDCALHNAPASAPGACDCKVSTTTAEELERLVLVLPMVEAQREIVLSAAYLLRRSDRSGDGDAEFPGAPRWAVRRIRHPQSNEEIEWAKRQAISIEEEKKK